MTTFSHIIPVKPGHEIRIQGVSLSPDKKSLAPVVELQGVPKDNHHLDITPFIGGTHMALVIPNDHAFFWIKPGRVWWPILEPVRARVDEPLQLSWSTDCGDRKKDVTVYLTISFNPEKMEIKLDWTIESRK